MREKTDLEVISYLESENAFTESVMEPTEKFQAALYKEILGRIKQTDLSVPYKYGNIGITQGRKKENNIRCIAANTVRWRRRADYTRSQPACKRTSIPRLGLYKISDDGNLLLYSLDTTGYREYRGYVRLFERGKFCRTHSGR